VVQVAAFNEAARGPWSAAITASTTTPPARPTTLRQISRTGTTAVIGWTRASDEDEPITGYRIQWASDGYTWHDVIAGATDSSATIQGLPIASAIDIRVRAENAAGVSSWTTPLLVATSGMNAQSVVVADSYGSPVIGGRVTWVTPNGAFQSAVDYGLTSNGSVTFPIAPAGQVNLVLTGVLLPGGATADYSTTALFGAGRTPTVRFPAEPSRSQHVVRVTLPNGMPVMGATVTSTELDQTATVDGVTFTTPAVVSNGITNEFGEVYLVGYSNSSTTVNIEYNDGVLIQRLSSPLGRADADFQFEEMPWIDSTIDTTTASVGKLVSIPVTVDSSAATVRVVAPAGAAQTCRGRVLSARVNAAGRATLKVCASASGKYVLVGTGAVSTGAVQLNVLGTKSLGVRNAVAVSRTHATATVTWTAPAFTGGKPITGYTVKLISPAGATISKVVRGTTATFTGLRGATKYTVKIIPTTKLGNGVTVTRTVPVS
jgi:titin